MILRTKCFLLGAVLSAVFIMIPIGSLKTYADGNMLSVEVNVEDTESVYNSVDNRDSSLETDEMKGLLYKEYKVIVKSVKMRSGPGTNYSVTGTKYKGNIVLVRKISNGWAKIKENNKIHYLPSSSIQKCE